MLGEEHHSLLLSSSLAIFEWHCRANGWYPQEYSSSSAQTSTSRQWMVVVCLSIRRTYDERESSRKRMATSTVWSAGRKMEVPWQSPGKVIGWSRLCRISSRHRCLAEWYRPHYAGWCRGQRTCTQASRPSKIPPESKHRSQWAREGYAVAYYSRWVWTVQVGRPCRSCLSRNSILRWTRRDSQAHLYCQYDTYLYEISSIAWHPTCHLSFGLSRQRTSKRSSPSWTNTWPSFIQAEEECIWQEVQFCNQSQKHSSDTESRGVFSRRDAGKMASVDLQGHWELLAEYSYRTCWPFLTGQMEKLRQMASSMSGGLCSHQTIDPISADRWWCPGRLQAQKSIGGLWQLCLC